MSNLAINFWTSSMPVLISRTIKVLVRWSASIFPLGESRALAFSTRSLSVISIRCALHDLSIIHRQVSRLEIFEILLGSLCGRERISFGLEPAGSGNANDIAVLVFAQTIGVDD